MIKIELTPAESVRLASAATSSIERMRQFCRDTDDKYGSMNNMHRDAIDTLKTAHATLLVGLREAGWPMTDQDIQDDDIDNKIED